LGLAIVKKMIEEHHGQIKIENNQTGGACITIVLPIEKSTEKSKQSTLADKNKKRQTTKVQTKQKVSKAA
jgi:hypothetical protein